MTRTRVLHLEVGGTYGGSTKALQLYLGHSDNSRLEHDVLFYYPTNRLDGFSRSGLKFRVLVGDKQTRVVRSPGIEAAKSGITRKAVQAIAANSRARELVDLARALPLVPRLRAVIAKGNYQVVHVNNTFTNQPASIIAAAMAGCPVVAHVRAPVVNPGPVARALGRRCAAMATVNRFLADELLAAGFRCSIHNVWDSIEAPPVPADSEIRKAREFVGGSGEFLIGSVGRLQHNKGFDTFIRAARMVAARQKNVRFVISGEGPQRDRLEQLLGQLDLRERFMLAGFYPDAYALMCAMDVFVCSSVWEGGPLALLEAMALGRPVVSSAMGLAPEIIVHGGNGLMVPPADAGAMADAICSMIASGAGGRREMAAEGQRAVIPFTDLRVRAEQLDGIFAAVASG